jgi:cyclic beta-1,2-glucan synthetase
VEPYVTAADVYAVAPHTGRGGWTWYTGAASWFWRVVVNHVLGLRVVADSPGERVLVVDPCLPKTWGGFGATYRTGGTTYEIEVTNPRGVNRGVERLEVDGVVHEDLRIPLADDGVVHQVKVTLLGG